MPNETMDEQSTSTLQNEADTSEASPEEQGQLDASDEADFSIPQKFVGKSPAEIIASYQELEKKIGQLGSEKSKAEKAAEDAAKQAAFYEQQLAVVSQQGRTAPQQSSQEQDPIAVFEKAWETEGPREAIKKLVAFNQEQFSKTARQDALRNTQSYVEKLKKENPDFVELMPEMEKLAKQYEPFLHPDVAISPAAVDMVYNLAKAQNLPKYVQAEAAKTTAVSEITKTKKRQATSESSHGSQGETTVDFANLSRAEMQKMLGYADK